MEVFDFGEELILQNREGSIDGREGEGGIDGGKEGEIGKEGGNKIYE